MSKICGKCKELLDFDKFSKKKDSKDGYASKCKSCHNEYCRDTWYPKNATKQKTSSKNWKQNNKAKVLASNYNVPLEDVNRILDSCNGSCKLCGNKSKELVFDHCHTTNRGRGMLCTSCNTLLGRLGDSLESVNDWYSRIVNYLKSDP